MVRIFTEVTSTPTRPVKNVVITTKGLQDRNNLLLDVRTVENKGKLNERLNQYTSTHNVLFIFIPMLDLMLILLKNNLNGNKNNV